MRVIAIFICFKWCEFRFFAQREGLDSFSGGNGACGKTQGWGALRCSARLMNVVVRFRERNPTLTLRERIGYRYGGYAVRRRTSSVVVP